MSQFRSYEEFFRELCKEEQYPPPRVIQPWLDKKPKYLINQSTQEIVFSSQEVNTVSEIRKVAAFNLGYQPLRVREVITTGPFVASVSGSAKEVPKDGMLTISVMFVPRHAGIHTGRVYIRFHEDEGTFVDLKLTGITSGEVVPPVNPDPNPEPEPGSMYLAALGITVVPTGVYTKIEGANPTYSDHVEIYGTPQDTFFYSMLSSPVRCTNGYTDPLHKTAEFTTVIVRDRSRSIEEAQADTWELTITPPWPTQEDGSAPTVTRADWAETQVFLGTYLPTVSIGELGVPEGSVSLRVRLPGIAPAGHRVELKSSSGAVIEMSYNPQLVDQGGGSETSTLKINALGINAGPMFSEIENHAPLVENTLEGGQVAKYYKDVAKPVKSRNTYDSTRGPAASCPILIIGDSSKNQLENAAVTWTMEITPPWPANHAGIEPALQVFDWANLQMFFGIYFPDTLIETFAVPVGSSGLSLSLPGEYEEGHTIKLKSSSGEEVEIKFNPVPVVITS